MEEIQILRENWTTVMVFRRCRPSWLTGMHAPLYDGIAALEVEAAIRLLQVSPEEVPDVIEGIDVMVSTVREAYSEPKA